MDGGFRSLGLCAWWDFGIGWGYCEWAGMQYLLEELNDRSCHVKSCCPLRTNSKHKVPTLGTVKLHVT